MLLQLGDYTIRKANYLREREKDTVIIIINVYTRGVKYVLL